MTILILNRLPKTIPEYTNHGIIHSTNVLANLIELDKNYKFTEEEKLVLALASLLHDIGCIIDRDRHNFTSLEILDRDEYKKMIDMLSEEQHISLKQVIVSHSKEYPLEIVISDLTKNIRLSLICPLFRLADALDITSNRVEEIIYNIYTENKMLPKNSVDIWKSHLAISDVKIENFLINIETRSLLNNEFCLNDLLLELDPINNYLIKHQYKKLDIKVVFKGDEQKRNEFYLFLIDKINDIKKEVNKSIQKEKDDENIYGKLDSVEDALNKSETLHDLAEVDRMLDEILIKFDDIE